MGFYKCGRLLVFVLLLFAAANAFSQIKVVDANDRQPVASASVYDAADGTFLGVTDYDGFIPAAAAGHDNIHIQHINYSAVNVSPASCKNSDVLLSPFVYQLPDVKVERSKDAELRMKVYIRQYRVLKGKPASFSESIAYLYFKNGDEDKPSSRKILSENRYENHNAMTGESKMLRALASCSDPTMFVSFNGYKYYNVLRGSRKIRGSRKDGGIMYMNEDAVNKRCEIVHDSLFSDKPLKVPMFGFSFGDLYTGETYSTENGTPKVYDLLNATYRYRVYQTKTMGYVDEYVEFYVLGIDCVTKDEIKADKKLKSVELIRPKEVVDKNDFMFEATKTMTKIEN